MWAGPSLECIYRRLPAEWYPRGQLPARPCGQMFTEIAETDPPTHARIHSTSMLRGRSMLGPGQTPGAQRGAGTGRQHTRDLRHGTAVRRAELRRSNGGEGTYAPLEGKPSQRKGRAMLEVGFEG